MAKISALRMHEKNLSESRSISLKLFVMSLLDDRPECGDIATLNCAGNR